VYCNFLFVNRRHFRNQLQSGKFKLAAVHFITRCHFACWKSRSSPPVLYHAINGVRIILIVLGSRRLSFNTSDWHVSCFLAFIPTALLMLRPLF